MRKVSPALRWTRMHGPGATSGKNSADCAAEHDQSSNFRRFAFVGGRT